MSAQIRFPYMEPGNRPDYQNTENESCQSEGFAPMDFGERQS
jgi:hypothetical protein